MISFVLNSQANYASAIRAVSAATVGSRVDIREPKRSNDQNKRMMACLDEIAEQGSWHGRKLNKDQWRLIFLQALKAEMDLVPNMAGDGFINISRSTTKLSKEEMSDMLELINAYAAQNNIVTNDG